MPNLLLVLTGLGVANGGQSRVDELLCTVASIDRRTEEEVTNSHQRTVHSSKIHSLRSETRRLRDRLNESDAHPDQSLHAVEVPGTSLVFLARG